VRRNKIACSEEIIAGDNFEEQVHGQKTAVRSHAVGGCFGKRRDRPSTADIFRHPNRLRKPMHQFDHLCTSVFLLWPV
jgi:hypothetical protein